MDELERLRQENECLKNENAQLKELVETIAEINRSNEIGVYIKERKRAIALAWLINKASSTVVVNISQAEKTYEQAEKEKTGLDAKILKTTGISMQSIQNDGGPSTPEDQFTYKDIMGGAEIISYLGNKPTIKIPRIINNRPVVSIGEKAFRGGNVKRVYLPNTVQFIKEKAFIGCSRLEYINLPESIQYLGEYCFSLTRLSEITIPPNISKIPHYCFSECRSLMNVELKEGLRVIGKYAFLSTKLEKVIIPESVSIIEENAFSGIGSKTWPIKLMLLGNPSYSRVGLENVIIEQQK